MLPLVTLADDRQRHEDEWWWVEMAALTARRVVNMIAESSAKGRSCGRAARGGAGGASVSVGAKISYLDSAAVETDRSSYFRW